MPYVQFRMGGGLSLKADATSIPDDALVRADGCSFDILGAVSSARGRTALNDGMSLGASVLGHFDGAPSANGAPGSTKYRYTKAGATVYEDFTVDTGNPAELWPGRGAGTGIAYSATGTLSGFVYGDYVYMADGSTTARYNRSTPVQEAWGLTSPGFQYLTNTDPLTTVDTSTTVTVDTPNPVFSGMTGDQNIELVGMEAVGGVRSLEINKLHHPFTAAATSDITVSGTNTTAQMTFTFGRLLAAEGMEDIKVDPTDLDGYTGTDFIRFTAGGENPDTNEVQKITINAVSGTFRLVYYGRYRSSDEEERTEPITYSAGTSITDVQTAMNNLSQVSQSVAGDDASTAAMVTTSQFTFEALNAATSVTPRTGGGSIGFMRQAPKLTEAASGDLREGRYYYAYTFYNGVAESNFSAQIPVDVSAAGKRMNISAILPGPVGTTERRIYRTDVNQRQLYYLGKIKDNTTLTYTDYNRVGPGADPYFQEDDLISDEEFGSEDDLRTIEGRRAAKRLSVLQGEADDRAARLNATNLGILADWTDHDPPPHTLSEVGILNETAFGIDSATGFVRFALAGQPEHWPPGNRLKPGRNSAEAALTWRAFDRDCIVYTDSGLYRFSSIGLDFQDARYEEIDSPVGLAGKRAIAALDGQMGHVFLAKSGLYIFDGARVNEISYSIETMFTDSTHPDYIHPDSMTNAVAQTSRDRLYLAYNTEATGDNNRMLVVDFQDIQNPKFSVTDFALTTIARERADNILVAGNASGYVYTLDDGYTDATGGLGWDIITKDFQLAGGAAFALDEVFLDGDFAGASTTVKTTIRQRSAVPEHKTCTHTISTDGRQRVQLKVPTYMKGEAVQIQISSTDTERRDLFTIGFTYYPMGEP